MARSLGLALTVAAAVWLGWTIYRHVAVYLFRGRIVVVTDRVFGDLVLAGGVIGIASVPFPTWIVFLVLALAAAASLRWAELWLVVGASTDLVLRRGSLVLRGMGFAFDEGGPSLEERGGRIRVSVATSLSTRTHLLRLRTARGINKVALFKVNFRKFLVAIPRERR